MVRDSATAYCHGRLASRVIETNRNEVFHREIMTEMVELGLPGSTIPSNMAMSAPTMSAKV